MRKKLEIITCPNCGCEYLPAEIYLPNSFLGKPHNIEKENLTGKVRDFFGHSMDIDEKYICDKCNQPFRVTAKIQFITEGIDFNTEYKTKLRKESLFLDEE